MAVLRFSRAFDNFYRSFDRCVCSNNTEQILEYLDPMEAVGVSRVSRKFHRASYNVVERTVHEDAELSARNILRNELIAQLEEKPRVVMLFRGDRILSFLLECCCVAGSQAFFEGIRETISIYHLYSFDEEANTFTEKIVEIETFWTLADALGF